MPLSRYFARQPFSPLAAFVVTRPFDLNGDTMVPGTPMPTNGLDERLLRNLYDQRKIDIVANDPAQAPAPPPAAPEAPAPRGRARKTDKAATEAPTAPARYRVKQAGFGGFKVIDAAGVPQGEGWPTEADALKEIERLNAL